MTNNILTIQEVIAKAKKHEEEWAKKIYIDDGYLVLNIKYPYEIKLSRIDSKLKLLAWIGHLIEKNWVSRDVIYYLIITWERHFKESIELNV